jgi:hypothetical protein
MHNFCNFTCDPVIFISSRDTTLNNQYLKAVSLLFYYRQMLSTLDFLTAGHCTLSSSFLSLSIPERREYYIIYGSTGRT